MGLELTEFHIMEPEDEDGVVMLKTQDKHHFLVARNRYHLMCAFQCDLCHFVNICKWRPIDYKPKDTRLLRCIRWANLDAFWAKESKTVNKNFGQAKRAVDIAMVLGIPDPFPIMCPFPVNDEFGMKAAAIMLMRSLDIGKYAPTIQFSTMQKMRSAFFNAYHSSAEG